MKKTLAATFFITVLSFCVVFAYHSYAAKSELQRTADTLPKVIERAKQAGVWIEAKDMPNDSAIPESQNAAVLYKPFIGWSRYPGYDEEEYNSELNFASGKYSKSDVQAAGRVLKKEQKLIETVELAINLPYCIFKKDWSNAIEVLFPEYALSRRICRLYAIKAVYENEQHLPDFAILNLKTAADAYKQINNSPLIIGELVQVADFQILNKALFVIVKNNASDMGILSIAKTLMNETGPMPNLSSAIPFELFMVHNMLSLHPKSIEAGFPDIHLDSSSSRDKVKLKAVDAIMITAYTDLYSKLKPKQNDFAASIKSFDEFNANSEKLARRPGYELAALILPMFAKAESMMASAEAKRLLTLTYIDILGYKNMSGSFPKNLNKLHEPNDPFTNEPFIYTTTSKGFKIYSVGMNLIDDGGSDVKDESGQTKDIVLSYP